jgi:alpha-glucoside transport system permease protein
MRGARMHLGRRTLVGWMFVLPAVLLMAVFVVYPMLVTIRLSFLDGPGYDPKTFVGLRNYFRLLTQDPFFLKLTRFPPSGSLVNNGIWLVLFPTLTIGFGLLISVLADRVRYESLVKSIVFMPMAISYTAAGVIWTFMYSPDPRIGLINAALTALVPGMQPVSWMGDVRFVNVAIILAAVWMSTGFALVILSAGLKAIPHELMEAARVEGAGGWRIFRSIQVPLLAPLLSFLIINDIIAVIKIYDLIFIMGGKTGGPAGSARVIAFTQYIETFQSARIGYGSAVAVIMLLLILPLIVLNIRRFRQEDALR